MIYYIFFSEMGGVRGGMLDLSSSIAKFGSEKGPLYLELLGVELDP